jgi:hypothetical protein
MFRDWIVEVDPVKLKPDPLVVADIVATGVPLAIPVTANCAEDVEVDPRARSTVFEKGDNKPLFNCQ